MTVPSYSVTSGHPRVFWRAADKSTLTARTNSASAWQTYWDDKAIPRANTFKAASDATNGGSTIPHLRWMVLTLVGWIEETGRPVNGYKDKAIKAALWLAAADPPNPENAYERYILLGLALVFDFCFDDMTGSERSTLANEIIFYCEKMSSSSNEKMDGHSGNDMMCCTYGALAVHGHHASAQTQLDRALNFWYGAEGDPTGGRIDFERQQASNGGYEKGSTYLHLGLGFGALMFMWAVKHGTNIDVFTQESTWASKVWEWIIWDQYRGANADDWEAHGDTGRIEEPQFLVEMRWVFNILATQYTNTGGLQGGQMMRYLYDTYEAIQEAIEPASTESKIYDVIFLDRANITSTAPKDATTEPSPSRFFDPPGVFRYRRGAVGTDPWDYENTVVARANFKRRYWLGHYHLDGGSLAVHFKGDPILLSPAGSYGGGGTTTSSTAHYNNALQRSWLQSMVPLIFDASAPNSLSPSYQRFGTVSANDGGQQFQKFVRSGSTVSDPNNVNNMLNEGGGLAWLRCESCAHTATSNYDFVRGNIRTSYRKFHTDQHRVPICEVKYLFIHPTAGNTLPYPAILYYARIKKADPDWVTSIPMHFHGAVTTTSYGAHATGYNAVNSISPAGKLWVDIRTVGDYTRVNNTPGTLDGLDYGANQFKVRGTGTNYKPTGETNTREWPDVKYHSLYVEKTTPAEEDHYVMLLMLTGSADSEPVSGRAWVTDGAQPNYYGITLGSSTYMLHRTLDEAVFGTPDTTAPANVTGFAVAARELAILTTWTDPADSDLAGVEIEYRTSAT